MIARIVFWEFMRLILAVWSPHCNEQSAYLNERNDSGEHSRLRLLSFAVRPQFVSHAACSRQRNLLPFSKTSFFDSSACDILDVEGLDVPKRRISA
jgi:hypothetical protein